MSSVHLQSDPPRSQDSTKPITLSVSVAVGCRAPTRIYEMEGRRGAEREMQYESMTSEVLVKSVKTSRLQQWKGAVPTTTA